MQNVILTRAKRALLRVDKEIAALARRAESLGDAFSPLESDARAAGPGSRVSDNAIRFGLAAGAVTGDCVTGYSLSLQSNKALSEQVANLAAMQALSDVRNTARDAAVDSLKGRLTAIDTAVDSLKDRLTASDARQAASDAWQAATTQAIKQLAYPTFAVASGQVVAELRAHISSRRDDQSVRRGLHQLRLSETVMDKPQLLCNDAGHHGIADLLPHELARLVKAFDENHFTSRIALIAALLAERHHRHCRGLAPIVLMPGQTQLLPKCALLEFACALTAQESSELDRLTAVKKSLLLAAHPIRV